MVNKMVRWILIFCLACTGGTLLAAEPVNISVNADYYTKYLWRGQNLNNGSVFQPSVSVSKNGFTASVWSSLDLTTKNQHSGEFTEIDYALDYTTQIPGDANWISFSAGAIYYDFPNTTSEVTTEVYGGLNFDLPLKPFVRWYRDVDAFKGSYFQLGVGHTVEKIMHFSDKCYCGLQLGSSIGYGNSQYNKGYFSTEGGKMNDWTSSASLPICLDAWTIKPSVNYSTMISDDIRLATARSDNFWMGLGISRQF